MTDIKKDFQKTIAKIRADRKKINEREEFPKAMLTCQQAEKRTATVNCGGEWKSLETEKEIADAVMTDERFISFLERHSATARVEGNPFGGVQIRINY